MFGEDMHAIMVGPELCNPEEIKACSTRRFIDHRQTRSSVQGKRKITSHVRNNRERSEQNREDSEVLKKNLANQNVKPELRFETLELGRLELHTTTVSAFFMRSRVVRHEQQKP